MLSESMTYFETVCVQNIQGLFLIPAARRMWSMSVSSCVCASSAPASPTGWRWRYTAQMSPVSKDGLSGFIASSYDINFHHIEFCFVRFVFFFGADNTEKWHLENSAVILSICLSASVILRRWESDDVTSSVDTDADISLTGYCNLGAQWPVDLWIPVQWTSLIICLLLSL